MHRAAFSQVQRFHTRRRHVATTDTDPLWGGIRPKDAENHAPWCVCLNMGQNQAKLAQTWTLTVFRLSPSKWNRQGSKSCMMLPSTAHGDCTASLPVFKWATNHA